MKNLINSYLNKKKIEFEDFVTEVAERSKLDVGKVSKVLMYYCEGKNSVIGNLKIKKVLHDLIKHKSLELLGPMKRIK